MVALRKDQKSVVGTIEVAFLGEDRARLDLWVSEGERQEASYHAILHFLMYYARMLFFLSFRDAAYDLVERMNEAVHALAAAAEGERVVVAADWRFDDASTETPRAVWSSELMLLRPGDYRCKDTRPESPEDRDGQAVSLLHLQRLIDTLPTLERAYLALGIAGMHEYYETGVHWHSSKSLHPAPAFGMAHARRVLRGTR